MLASRVITRGIMLSALWQSWIVGVPPVSTGTPLCRLWWIAMADRLIAGATPHFVFNAGVTSCRWSRPWLGSWSLFRHGATFDCTQPGASGSIARALRSGGPGTLRIRAVQWDYHHA